MRLLLKVAVWTAGGLTAVVLSLIAAGALAIYGPGVWSSIRGEPDYSVTLPPDARPVAERYEVLTVADDDGREHRLMLARALPPPPPPNRFLTGPESLVAQSAEQILRASGIAADVYVVRGADTGKPVTVISLDLGRGEDPLLPGGSQDLNTTIDELLRAGRSEGIDLAGVAIVLHNEQGEPVVAIGTSAEEMRAFREGEIPMEEAIDHLGISLVDRRAIIGLLTGLRGN